MTDVKGHPRRFSLQSQLETLSNEERDKANIRLECLQKQVSVMPWYGDTIHDGSRLAWMFATEDNNLDVEDVAHEMASAHYLHQYTTYPEMVQTRLRAVADLLHDAYPQVPWNTLWKYVRRFGVPIVKYAASIQIANTPKTVPNVDDEAYNNAFEYGFDQGYDAGVEAVEDDNSTSTDIPDASANTPVIWNGTPRIESWADASMEDDNSTY